MIDLNTFITKKETLISKKFDSSIDIAICFDKNYSLPAGVLLTSILENNPESYFHIHLFVLSINQDDVEKFKQFSSKNVCITLYYVNENFFINPDTLVISHVSIASCLRLFIAEYLSEITARLLYLDCDMVCNGNLAEMVNYDFGDKIVAVVADSNSMQKKQCKACNIEYGTYFNSGMLYINVNLWKKFNVTERALNKINDGNVYRYGDQDVLNLLLSGNVLYLSSRYNCLTSKNQIEKMIKSNEINQNIILHYAGTKKPWFIIYMDSIYKRHFNASPWRDSTLKLFEQQSASSLKRYSIYLYQNGKYLSAMQYATLFLLNKLHLMNSFKNKDNF